MKVVHVQRDSILLLLYNDWLDRANRSFDKLKTFKLVPEIMSETQLLTCTDNTSSLIESISIGNNLSTSMLFIYLQFLRIE